MADPNNWQNWLNSINSSSPDTPTVGTGGSYIPNAGDIAASQGDVGAAGNFYAANPTINSGLAGTTAGVSAPSTGGFASGVADVLGNRDLMTGITGAGTLGLGYLAFQDAAKTAGKQRQLMDQKINYNQQLMDQNKRFVGSWS